MTTKHTIEIARKLVNRLPKNMADELNMLIARVEKTPDDITTDIIAVLTGHENSLLWFFEQMELQSGKRDGTRGFGPLAGEFSPLAGDSSASISNKWICPKDNMETLPVIQEGESAPVCEKHKIEMVRGNKAKG
jgi:hypothetical protein